MCIKGRGFQSRNILTTHPLSIRFSTSSLFKMVSKYLFSALQLASLVKGIYGQVEVLAERPAKYVDDTPEAEKVALASIVEDDPADVVTLMAKDWESPEYPLIFGKALPIPPAKQPK